ncbi:Histidinol-phosphate aminotransferase [Sorangium cellulosum So ce56]|uniref:Histidinol-phosphate aminotransferase n=1 Tax=Sorangium cellulosum (strain So ce56) TaxID=448385 RepID=A9EX43_SORC5|nr:histidinol-phosphate transaminase [Sorangium cellulosum]CAN94378.1 Histidinol-phosphate aminotransferase [Sorangium cellulosum So ce56]
MPLPDFLPALLRPELAELHAYTPVAGHFPVRLDANESPPLLSAEARAALARAAAPEDWGRYPDARALDLREAIAAHCGAEPDEILAGVGSDEVISIVLTALSRPRQGADAASIVTVSPTFVMYKLSARARGMRVVEVPLDAGWDLDVAGLRRAVDFALPNVVFIASPNNPTGALMSEDRLEAVVTAASDALVIVDEAYIDFAPRDQLALLRKHPNVAVLRTLSKIGLASLRIGWLIGARELVAELDKVRQPYNLPTPSQRAAAFALRELGGELRRAAAAVTAERERLAAGLAALGLSVAPSHANFLWIGTRRPAGEVFEALAARGVLVRSFHAAGGRLAHRLRITVGLPEENDRLLAEIAACA